MSLGPTILPPVTVGAGVIRTQYRRAVGKELGGFRVLEVTTEAQVTGAVDADRQIMCRSLEADQQGAEAFDGWYAYVCNGVQAGQSRKLLTGAYDGRFGNLLVDLPYTDAAGIAAPLAAGTEIELSRWLPCDYHLGTKGLNQCVDEALALCRIEARIEAEGNGTRSYGLGDYPWILSPDQIKGIRDRVWGLSSTEPNDWSPYPWDLNVNGATVTLETGATYSTADTFEIVVFTEGDRLIRDGSAWGYAEEPGLPNDAARGAAPLHWVRIIGCYKALGYLIEVTEEDASLSDAQVARRVARFERRKATYAGAGARIAREQFPQQRSVRSSPLVGVASDCSGWP